LFVSESLLRSRFIPLAALGTTLLTLAGCRALGWGESQAFTFGCPADTPAPKVGRPLYKDVPGSFKNTLQTTVSCVDPATGQASAPTQLETGKDAPDHTQEGETEYTFTLYYSVDSSQPPADVRSIDFHDPEHPDAAVVTMEGMYSFDEMTGPQAASATP
jgi:hypothetical protein